MKIDALYPYTLKKKDEIIKLEIMPKKIYGLLNVLYMAVIIMSALSVIGCTMSLFFINNFTFGDYLIVICITISCIMFFLLALYLFKWERSGKEIFILYPDKLENIIVIKPFRTEKHLFKFSKLEIGYQSGEDFYSEEKAELLGMEPDLEKVEGNYPIQFYMDDGIEIVDSEREIPIKTIRRIKKEFLIIKTN